MDTTAKGLFDFLFNLINVFVSSMFLPIHMMFGNFVSSLLYSNFIQNFYNILNTYVVPCVGWFVELIPPFTWSVLLLHFSIVIGIFAVSSTLHLILKPLRILKRLIPFV